MAEPSGARELLAQIGCRARETALRWAGARARGSQHAPGGWDPLGDYGPVRDSLTAPVNRGTRSADRGGRMRIGIRWSRSRASRGAPARVMGQCLRLSVDRPAETVMGARTAPAPSARAPIFLGLKRQGAAGACSNGRRSFVCLTIEYERRWRGRTAAGKKFRSASLATCSSFLLRSTTAKNGPASPRDVPRRSFIIFSEAGRTVTARRPRRPRCPPRLMSARNLYTAARKAWQSPIPRRRLIAWTVSSRDSSGPPAGPRY